MKRVLVTGGAGFIGSHVCERLLGGGAEVRVLDDLSTGRLENLAHVPEATLHRGCITSTADVESALVGCTHVVHLAAVVSVAETVSDPVRSDRINHQGTLTVLEAARRAGVERVVLATSAAAYGDEPTLPKVESFRAEPLSPYAVAKVANEHYARVYSSLYGLECVPLRFFNVFGPRQDPSGPYAGVISKFVERLTAGATPLIYGDGLQSRDFVYVGDVARAVEGALLRPGVPVGEPINIGTGHPVSLLDLLGTLSALLGRPSDPAFAPARAGDIRHSVADCTRARDVLRWTPAVSLRDGLDAMLRSSGPSSA
jgi:UDP-glucose 4-epimerase